MPLEGGRWSRRASVGPTSPRGALALEEPSPRGWRGGRSEGELAAVRVRESEKSEKSEKRREDLLMCIVLPKRCDGSVLKREIIVRVCRTSHCEGGQKARIKTCWAVCPDTK